MMKNVQVYLMDIAIFKNMSDLWFLQSIITMNLFGGITPFLSLQVLGLLAFLIGL